MTKKEVYKYIGSDPEIVHGNPYVKGTRIPVSLIVGMLGNVMTEKEILLSYPSLTSKSIKAALKYASLMCEYEIETI
ncbi:MAG: DUF433 domain-containing protein [Bacteroidia bacterium]|nr:DUF433 domain-containing protein [Bacteroidia bacterium]